MARPYLRCGPPCPARASTCGERVHARMVGHRTVPVVCDAARMPGIGIAQGADAAAARSLRRRPRLADLTESPTARYVLGVLALALLYRGAAQIGYALQFAGPVAAIVWLPVGIGVAFLYLGGLRYWPGVLIGDLLANDYGALPLGSALGQTARQRAGGHRRDGALAPARPARRPARERRRGQPDAARDRGRHRGQRLGRVPLAAARRRDRRARDPGGVAHVVARRRVGGADRAAARARLGEAPAAAAGGSIAAPRPC